MTEIHQYYALIAGKLLIYFCILLAVVLFCRPENKAVSVKTRSKVALAAAITFLVYACIFPEIKSGMRGGIIIFWAKQCRWVGCLTAVLVIANMLRRNKYYHTHLSWTLIISAAGGIVYRLLFLGGYV